jgi:hypothetical protein
MQKLLSENYNNTGLIIAIFLTCWERSWPKPGKSASQDAQRPEKNNQS